MYLINCHWFLGVFFWRTCQGLRGGFITELASRTFLCCVKCPYSLQLFWDSQINMKGPQWQQELQGHYCERNAAFQTPGFLCERSCGQSSYENQSITPWKWYKTDLFLWKSRWTRIQPLNAFILKFKQRLNQRRKSSRANSFKPQTTHSYVEDIFGIFHPSFFFFFWCVSEETHKSSSDVKEHFYV